MNGCAMFMAGVVFALGDADVRTLVLTCLVVLWLTDFDQPLRRGQGAR